MHSRNRTKQTSQMILLLQNTLAGAVAQELSDTEVRDLIMAIIDDDKKELNTPDAADYLNKSVMTLKRWRKERIGPKYRKEPGGSIRYRLDWLREFQEEGVIYGRMWN